MGAVNNSKALEPVYDFEYHLWIVIENILTFISMDLTSGNPFLTFSMFVSKILFQCFSKIRVSEAFKMSYLQRDFSEVILAVGWQAWELPMRSSFK